MAIQRVEAFIAALIKAGNKKSIIKELCQSELNYLRKSYEVSDTPNDKGIYKGLFGYMSAISNYRKNIFDYDAKHIALKEYFKASEIDTKHKSEQNKNSALRCLTETEATINDIDSYMSTSIQLCNAASYADNILGIAALTGRRVAEVAFFSTFDLCKKDEFDKLYNRYGIIDCDGLRVINLAKKEWYNRENNDKDNSWIIPVLYNADFILTAIKNLRLKKTFDSYEQFHNSASKELSKRVKKHYQSYIGKCGSHDLRKAYCRIVFDYYANVPEKAFTEVISVILCEKSMVNPALNYAKFS